MVRTQLSLRWNETRVSHLHVNVANASDATEKQSEKLHGLQSSALTASHGDTAVMQLRHRHRGATVILAPDKLRQLYF